MKAKNIGLNTLLYLVQPHQITALRPTSISKEQDYIRINFKCKSSEIAYPEEEKVGPFHLNISSAKEEQKNMRKQLIEKAYNEMEKAIKNYNDIIEEYFDKPLTSDSEVRIID